MSLRIGVIGVGRWGRNHVRIYSGLDCELVGIADVNPKAKKLADKLGIRYFGDYRDLLPFVDAVSVVVPTNLHYDVVKGCLKAGKHVLIEKPLTLKYSETMKLINMAKRKKLVLMVGYLFRFNAAVLELKKQIKNVGNIHYITARYIHSNKPPRKDSGVIFNFTTHLVDILSFIIEKKPKSVFCKKVNYLSKSREDCALIILDYGDFLVNLEVTWFHPLKKRDMWIIASKENIYVDFLEQMLTLHPIRAEGGKVVGERETNVEIHKNEPLKEELKSFCENVENGRVDCTEGEEIITKICDKCLESAELGVKIKLM